MLDVQEPKQPTLVSAGYFAQSLLAFAAEIFCGFLWGRTNSHRFHIGLWVFTTWGAICMYLAVWLRYYDGGRDA